MQGGKLLQQFWEVAVAKKEHKIAINRRDSSVVTDLQIPLLQLL